MQRKQLVCLLDGVCHTGVAVLRTSACQRLHNPCLPPCRPLPAAARLLGSLCGTPLLLWPAAVALTAYPPFRDAHMPAHPAAEPAKEEKTELTAAQAEASEAGAAAPPPTSAEERGPSAAQQAAEPAQEEQEASGEQTVPTESKKEL